MKDHEVRELVDALAKVATEYAGTQQLRERLSRLVVPAVDALRQRIQKLEDRLEVDHGHGWDGIACRDETIRVLEQQGVPEDWPTSEMTKAGAEMFEATLHSSAGFDHHAICVFNAMVDAARREMENTA